MIVNKYKVRFEYDYTVNKGTWRPTNTWCEIQDVEETEKVFVGGSFCSPRDLVNKALGRKIALTRALAVGGFTREQRAEFWQEYFKKNKKK